MAAGELRHRAGSLGGVRAFGKRDALHDPAQRGAAEPPFPAPAHRGGITDGGGRPTRRRPFPGAHGFQRHQTPQGRQHPDPRDADTRHRFRRARQRLHVLRRDRLHARPARPETGHHETHLRRAARLRGRRVAQQGGDRCGTRRDPRGEGFARFGGIPDDAETVPDDATRLAHRPAFPHR